MRQVLVFLLTFYVLSTVNSFMPELAEKKIEFLNKFLKETKVSPSLTHEEITRRGLIRSVAKYFYDNPFNITNDITRVNLTKVDNEYLRLKNLYYDYYGVWFCHIELDELIKEFYLNNVLVDFDPSTKNMPYAHFDAETFLESNERIIRFLNEIYSSIDQKNYKKARKLTGHISHTIQDFYSHSNWVEMGNTDINTNIGLPNLGNQLIIDKNESNACNNKCTLKTFKCATFPQELYEIGKLFGLNSTIFRCPIQYYVCDNNIDQQNKLVSGYASGESLPNGTPVNKPHNLMKCSHGGIIDSSSYIDAIGGINKDSGFSMFSPHADLHLIAANLAIKHTAYFFDQIRKRVGDVEFANFLQLDEREHLKNRVKNKFQICNSAMIIKSHALIFIQLLAFTIFFFHLV